MNSPACTPLLERLAAEVAASVRPPVALELQWDVVDDPSTECTSAWALELHLFSQGPGWHDSRYESVRLHVFPAERRDDRLEAGRVAKALADDVGLPLYHPDLAAQGGRGDSEWLRRLPPAPAVEYVVSWEAEWWADDGSFHEARGRESTPGRSGEAACAACKAGLEGRLPHRPLSLRAAAAGRSTCWTVYPGPSPARLPPRGQVREGALAAGGRPSAVAGAVLLSWPDAPALALMKAFEAAFGPPLRTWRPLARWRGGELSDEALDGLLREEIERRKRDWDRVRVLRSTARAGRSVAAFVRGERQAGCGTIQLIVALREAFTLSLADAKTFVESCHDEGQQAALDRALENAGPGGA